MTTHPAIRDVRNNVEARLRAEIRQTLDELLEPTDLKEEDGYYYIEQLDALKIHFTSSAWFDAGKLTKSGIPDVREATLRGVVRKLSHRADGQSSGTYAEGRSRSATGFFR